jgi:diguanylate cyclase
MHYDDSITDSRRYLRLALERLGRYNLPTDPLNYCIWYEYASGKNGPLNIAIDRYLETGDSFSTAMSKRLYSQFIADGTETATLLVRQALNKVFAELGGAIRITRQNFSRSENTLDSINEALTPTLTEADVEAIVARIRQEIQRLESSSSTFKAQLKQATREIDQLKSKMAQYRQEALKDPLTQIANRRGFEEALLRAMQAANATGDSLCLIMCDIDHFKKINDTHGHLVGDNVLRMVSATLKECTKGKDLVGRIGGEEFAIILPDTPPDGAMTLAENIRRTFAEMDLKKKNNGERLGDVTLSFGVTGYRQHEAAETFLNRADKALYASKENGRNRVTRQ